jgi:hypothetical protein
MSENLKPLLVVLPGTLTKAAIRKAERAGYVVLETETPDAVMPVVIDTMPLFHQQAIARAALRTIAESKHFTSAVDLRSAFAKRLLADIMPEEHPHD